MTLRAFYISVVSFDLTNTTSFIEKLHFETIKATIHQRHMFLQELTTSRNIGVVTTRGHRV